MSHCKYTNPITNEVSIGALNEDGVCVFIPNSKVDEYLKQPQSFQLFKSDPKIKENAHGFFIPKVQDLRDQDTAFSTQTKTPDAVSYQDCYNKVTRVLSASPDITMHLDTVSLEDIGNKLKRKGLIEDCDLKKNPGYTLKMMKKHMGACVPFFPKLAHFTTNGRALYFSHMLWYIKEFSNTQMGFAKFQSKMMQHHLNISASTEERLRKFFIQNQVFQCVYDRKSHYLNISVNWDGLNRFLTSFDSRLAIFEPIPGEPEPETIPSKNVEQALEEAFDHAIQNLSIEENDGILQEEPETSISPIKLDLTPQEEGVFGWFSDYMHKDASALTHDQMIAAIDDLGCVPLIKKRDAIIDSKYIMYDKTHPLRPYYDAGSMDGLFVLETLIREIPHLIPDIKALSDTPEFYYKGQNHNCDDAWSAREKVTYAFTRRIHDLVGLKNYATMIPHMSIVEWNYSCGAPEFVIATRNGAMATIIGSFLSYILLKYKDNFRYHIVPLEDGVY
jgi:hypothetical protein